MNELVEVKELRERYMYNINPWVSHVAKRGLRLFYTESDIEETDSDDDVDGKSSVVTANNDRKDGLRTKRKIIIPTGILPVTLVASSRQEPEFPRTIFL